MPGVIVGTGQNRPILPLPSRWREGMGREGPRLRSPKPSLFLPTLIRNEPVEEATEVNGQVENIGARRLQTVMEKLLEEVSFEAEDRQGTTLTVDAAYVDKQLSAVARNTDLSRFVL